MLPLILSEGVRRRGLTLQRVAALLSTNVARAFRLYPQKGVIALGSDGDVTLIDLDREWQIDDEGLCYKNKWSPYRGMRVHGKVERTVVRGRTVFHDDAVVGQPGYGRQVLPRVRNASHT